MMIPAQPNHVKPEFSAVTAMMMTFGLVPTYLARTRDNPAISDRPIQSFSSEGPIQVSGPGKFGVRQSLFAMVVSSLSSAPGLGCSVIDPPLGNFRPSFVFSRERKLFGFHIGVSPVFGSLLSTTRRAPEFSTFRKLADAFAFLTEPQPTKGQEPNLQTSCRAHSSHAVDIAEILGVTS